MKTVNLVQGSPDWLAHRAAHFNASDAPAMLGCSAYKTRAQLLYEMHTGITAEVDAATQRRFDDGHRFEAMARPLAESIIGDDLAPVVGTLGKLSASFDGLTMMGDEVFEHKTLNDELRAAFNDIDTIAPSYRDSHASQSLPKQYRVQMEQQLLVSGAARVLFMATKWHGGDLSEERYCWYSSNPALRAEIVAGWEQFAQDLAAYVPPEAAPAAAVGKAPDSLPALFITVKGEVTASNLADFKNTALTAIRSVNRDLSTDQDFADAAKAVTWCSDVEARIAAAKQHALSQTASIDELFRVMDEISAEAKTVRLDLDKLVTKRKADRKGEIVAAGIAALAEHMKTCNARFSRPYMPALGLQFTDFGNAIRGKSNFANMQSAVDTLLASAKIEANRIADGIDANVKYLTEQAGDQFKGLFADVAQIVLKATDDCKTLVDSRITTEKARLETERQRIEQEARDKLLADQKAEQERKDKEAAAVELAAAKTSEGVTLSPGAQALNEHEGAQRFASHHRAAALPTTPAVSATPAPTVVPISRPAPAAAEPASLTLGKIAERLGFTLTADFVSSLGIEPAGRERAAKLYRESDYLNLLDRLMTHVDKLRQPKAA